MNCRFLVCCGVGMIPKMVFSSPFVFEFCCLVIGFIPGFGVVLGFPAPRGVFCGILVVLHILVGLCYFGIFACLGLWYFGFPCYFGFCCLFAISDVLLFSWC